MWSTISKSNLKVHGAIWTRSLSTAAKIIKNDAIKFPELRVVVKDPETNKSTWQILSRVEALNMAKKQKLDLVLVSADSTPPVCKLENFSKLIQKEKEKEKKNRSNQKARTTKEILIKVGIDPHDLEIKMNRSKKFLFDGHPVKVSIFFHRKAMYKTQKHIQKNSHLSNLPLMDINEISSAVFNSLMDIPTTVIKKDITGVEDRTSTEFSSADSAIVTGDNEDLAESDSDPDDMDDSSSDTDSVISGVSDISDTNSDAGTVVSEVAIQKSDMPTISKFQMRREVTFIPKLAAIQQMLQKPASATIRNKK